MFYGAAALCALLVATGACAERWRWPEAAESVRIDTKVSFLDAEEQGRTRKERKGEVQADEVPFKEAEETEGFYNRGGASGRYPVRVESHRQNFRVDPHAVYSVDPYRDNGGNGLADSFQYCKCTTNPDCNPRTDIPNACSAGKVLCCFKKPNPNNNIVQSEIFNEVNDERAALLPGQERFSGPFPPPPESNAGGFSPVHRRPQQPAVLAGPGGPTGHIGPDTDLVRHENVQRQPAVLVGPGGPTGIVGPVSVDNHHTDAINGPPRDVGSSSTAQRGVLVGPGGPTGIIGPGGYRQQPILVGPGGPTGIIGPNYYRGGRLVGPRNPNGFGRNPGVLVGPGGPTGIIGPGRQLLVGPGGPTGRIGPRRSYYDA